MLSQQLKEQYSIQLNRRGRTISLLHPQSRKAVRLTTLGLDPTVLFQHMKDPFSQSFSAQAREQEKQYIDWVIFRRKRNEEKADRLLSVWDIYLDSSKSSNDRFSSRRFVEWCGCDPDNATEYQWLCEQRHNTALEEEMAREL